jgi:N-acetyl-anhydromuramyl-L-alanine amidase AmpD
MVGPSTVTRFCSDDTMAWHATINNPVAYGIEIAQSAAQPAFTFYEVATTVALCAMLCHKYDIPIEHCVQTTQGVLTQKGIYGHEDTWAGRQDGKSDPGHMWHWDVFIPAVRDAWAKLYNVTPPNDPTWRSFSPEIQEYAAKHLPGTALNLRSREYYHRDADGDERVKLADGSWLCRRAYTGQIKVLAW